tara:strand:- start:406 stop:1074 length:669 start_codon:yes stop_codon:yes gene_type:complete
MSKIALDGYKNEQDFRENIRITTELEIYFNKKITNIIKEDNGKKSDNKIIFHDYSIINIQNKKFKYFKGRGNSFDRRHVKDTFKNPFLRKYLTFLTLDRKNKMTKEQKNDFIKLANNNINDIFNYIKKCLIGKQNNNNDYFVIRIKQNNHDCYNGHYIISSLKLFNYIKNNINIQVKRTCIHLSKNIYLQRKGSDKTDNNPNHIQAKFKIDKEILDLCYKLI